jgi:hypothetical protein
MKQDAQIQYYKKKTLGESVLLWQFKLKRHEDYARQDKIYLAWERISLQTKKSRSRLSSLETISSIIRAILRNKWITEVRYRTADTWKPRGNAIVRGLACAVFWKLSFSVFPRVALPFPQFALLHSVTFVELRLITILGNWGCVAVASSLGVTSP